MGESSTIDAPWTYPPRIVCQRCGDEIEHPFGGHPDDAPNEGDVIACDCGARLELAGYDCDGDSERLRGVWQWCAQ